MSTVSGFVLGALAAATLTVYCTGEFSGSLRDALERAAPQRPPAEMLSQKNMGTATVEQATVEQAAVEQSGAETAAKKAVQQLSEITPAVTALLDPGPTPAEPTLEQNWADFAARADTLQPVGEFPWRSCFQRAAASYEMPESLLLAIASGESGFDPAARSDKDAVGLMQIRWPDTSRHLGVRREADLYDPCTNVAAGARYLSELAAQFGDNLHLAVAAYNYGPGRIDAGSLPEGALWYSRYIYQHLQRVLGNNQFPAYAPPRPGAAAQSGRQLLISFDRPYRARDFIIYLADQVPGLDLQQRSNALGKHDVVLLYQSESERLLALEAIGKSGVAPLVTL